MLRACESISSSCFGIKEGQKAMKFMGTRYSMAAYNQLRGGKTTGVCNGGSLVNLERIQHRCYLVRRVISSPVSEKG